MRVGFIGAGRMGFTFGKHLKTNGADVAGYFSRNIDSAKEAAAFTDTSSYETIEALVADCDTIFITVPDGQIAVVADQLESMGDAARDKILVHTSGALSSRIFSNMRTPVHGCSIHPIYATSSKYESYKGFERAFMTLEGDDTVIAYFEPLLKELGHKTKVISPEDKVRYHAACVMASNLVIGLYSMAVESFEACGFEGAEAEEALMPLFKNNAENLAAYGMRDALTGPVARGDMETVRKHKEVLAGDSLAAYEILTNALVKLVDTGRETG
ncbi:MAG: DUF2520 domain-containing protein [Lachnospiraceae bacterium]|nr:DUF2520 domain-containing protein [Lachnospiraceae bacterium]